MALAAASDRRYAEEHSIHVRQGRRWERAVGATGEVVQHLVHTGKAYTVDGSATLAL